MRFRLCCTTCGQRTAERGIPAARAAALVIGLCALVGGAARAQTSPVTSMGGAQLPGVPSSASAAGDGVPSFGDGAAVGSRTSIQDAGGLLGLRPADRPEILTLADTLRLAEQGNPELRTAAERLIQQEAALRRAYAAVLPQLTLSGSYTRTCTGGTSGVDCADRTTQLTTQDTIDQQATLFSSLGSVLGIAADAATDPAQAAELRRQSAELNAAAADIRSTGPKSVVVQPADVMQGALTLAVPVFNGRAYPLILNAHDAVEIAQRAQEQARQALLYNVTRAFHAAVAAQKLVAVATEQLASASRHKAATAARVEAQTQPPLSLRRAELEELRALQQQRTATATLDGAIAALGLVIGKDTAFAVAAPAPAPPPPVAVDVEVLTAQALQARPDVEVQRRALTVAERSVTDAWMQFLPSVNLAASARASSFTSGFVGDPVTGTVSLNASLPLYDGGVRYAALKDSASRVREERIRLRQVEDRVRAQVRGNLHELAVRREALDIARRTVDIARTSQAQAEALFAAGVGTALDVSDTTLQVYVAETDALNAELNLALASAGLRYMLGEGGAAAQHDAAEQDTAHESAEAAGKP